MEAIFFYKNGKTEVVEDVVRIEDYDPDVLIIKRRNLYTGNCYEVGILKDIIASIKIRYWKEKKHLNDKRFIF